MGKLTFRNVLDPDGPARIIPVGLGSIALTGRAPSLTIASTGGNPPGQGNVFNSGWEGAPSTGCSFNNLTDNLAWADYGPSGTCSASPPIAEVITSDKNSGSKCMRVHFKNGDGSNGPDFRIIKSFSTITTSYYRAYMKWDANWRWSPGQDHKTMIWGPPPEDQNVYFNLAGHPGGATAYPKIYSRLQDSFQADHSIFISPGVWNLIEMGVKWGASGWIRVKVNGVLASLSTTDGGAGYNPENVNPGSGCGYIKLDTTYNNFAYFEANVSGGASNCYYDDVAISSVNWIGA